MTRQRQTGSFPSSITALLIVVLISAIMPAHDAAAQHAAAGRNAADHYRRAFTHLEGLNMDDFQRMTEWRDAGGTAVVPPEVRSMLQSMDGALAELRRGAALERSDFGLDYSQGFDLLLPHLRPMRQLIQIAQADTLLRIQSGDINGAMRNSEAMIRASSHVVDDSLLISTLVGSAMFAQTDMMLNQMIAAGSIEGGEAARLLRAMDVLSDRDPFRMSEAIAMESTLLTDWIAGSLENEGGLEGLLDDLLINPQEDPHARAMVEQLQSGGREAFNHLLDEYDRGMNAAAEIFLTPDRDEAQRLLQEFANDVESGAFGPLAALLMPAMSKLLDNMHRVEDLLKDRRAMLRDLAQGLVLPGDLTNAAAEYLTAARRLKELDETALQAIFDPDASLDHDTAGAFDAIAGAIAAATERRHFDLSPYRTGVSWLAGAEAVALRDLIAALFARTRAALSDKDVSRAADLVATQFGVIAHLSTDDELVICLIAREAFSRLTPHVSFLAGETTVEESRPAHPQHHPLRSDAPQPSEPEMPLSAPAAWTTLQTAAARIPRSDPFGLQRSVATLRTRIQSMIPTAAKLTAATVTSEGDTADAPAAREQQEPQAVHQFGGEGMLNDLLFLAAQIDVRRHLTDPWIPTEDVLIELVEQLGSVYDQEAFRSARTAPRVQSARELIEQFRQRPAGEALPVIAPLDTYAASARRDLRALMVTIRAAVSRSEGSLEEPAP